MSNQPHKLVHTGELFSIEELHRLGLHVHLTRQGITDPKRFLEENDVVWVPIFKAGVGMSITITSIKPKASKVTTPPAADTDAG